MTLGIPQILAHIWIGHRPPPDDWMNSWRDFHPDWDYRLYDNETLFSRRWRHQDLITEYYRRGEYAGVSDLMRYELLHEVGGFIPEADSICRRNTDELWTKPALYTVYENEEKRPGLVSPFLAATPGHAYLSFILRRVGRRNSPQELDEPWKSVGNRFLRRAMNARAPENTVIFPSYYFIPRHKRDEKPYKGDGPVYCDQIWGSTLGLYNEPDGIDVEAARAAHVARLEQYLD